MAAAVTPVGALVYFAQYLAAGGLFDALCADSPLLYTSPNAPRGRDVLGTLVVSIINGQTRYAHIGAWRGDRVSAEVFGVSKFVSEDSVRRGLLRGPEQEWDRWLGRQEQAVWDPLLAEPYIVDLDNTVKPVYGHQEGAEKGYNPQKPGRPSHNYHTYFVGTLRLVLGVDVHPGKEHSGGYGMPGLWRLLDGLPTHCRPRLVRGDVSYGNEKGLVECEQRAQPYLFKLRQTTKVRKQIEQLERTPGAWHDRHLEAVTSRPLLLHAVGRLVTTGRREILRLTSTHAYAAKVRDVLDRIARFLNRLTAEQLTVEATWAAILSAAFSVWLGGKRLRPIAEGRQFVLQLQT